MKIELKKFGDILISRQSGREALMAMRYKLDNLPKNEKIIIDFEDVTVFTPSWSDEFITKLIDRFGNRISMINTQNPSVQAVFEILKYSTSLYQ